MQLMNKTTDATDLTECLRDQVAVALKERYRLKIMGGGTKAFLAAAGLPQADAGVVDLDVSGHAGIVAYDPAELVLTARAGTRLSVIESLLAANGQMLAFEPPHFGEAATLGGTVAAGLSGPRRPFAGSVRDSVLGCKMINGKAEVLSFGGRVMKNVAGFDLSRLMVGAMGTLGVLLELSVRVVPRPESEITLVFRMNPGEAVTAMNRWSGQPWPLSALAHEDGWTYVRLAGGEPALNSVRKRLGGDLAADGPGFWNRLREQRGRFFAYPPLGGHLWRLSIAPATPPIELPGHWLYDWGGAQRWLRSDATAEAVFSAAAQAGGHATLWRGAVARHGCVRQAVSPALQVVHEKLKQAFDPEGLFNPHGFRSMIRCR